MLGHRSSDTQQDLGETTTLVEEILGPHDKIRRMMAEAASNKVVFGQPRRLFALTDTFLAALSRHLAAVEDVVYPAARRALPEGKRLAAEQVRLARGMERTMRMIEGSLNGDIFERDYPRRARWTQMSELLDEHEQREREIVEQLDEALDADRRTAIVRSYRRALRRAPSRPHPYSPHSPFLGGLTHRLWSVADRAMDEMDVRVIPREQRRPRRRQNPAVAQYVLGTPTFEVPPVSGRGPSA